ncbi:hypothetical protein M422DRAFT_271508 [Sphaerobolus stellatus SS14]|uniref:Uncharacterized protein n=1 Tax=Sphaerobolus stellatus (strain SS14) TaxID=990650 RepID=A0A0C9UE32_SPHS4|nr:hypothetical protein M422DRAFT_271508 [Sphaerobolus stellatus SS14]
MPFTVNRVLTKLTRTRSRDAETPCANCGAYSEAGRSNEKEPITERAEMLDSEDMAW